MEKKERITAYILLGVLAIAVSLLFMNALGSQDSTKMIPVTGFYNIEDVRVRKDASYYTAPIYDESGEQEGCYIFFIHKDGDLIVECVNSERNGNDWTLQRDTYLRPFIDADRGL